MEYSIAHEWSEYNALHKKPKVNRFLSKKDEIDATREISNQNKISQNKNVQTGFVNLSENLELSALNVVKSGDLILFNKTHGKY